MTGAFATDRGPAGSRPGLPPGPEPKAGRRTTRRHLRGARRSGGATVLSAIGCLLATPALAAADYSFVAKWGSYGSGNGQLNGPDDVATDASGAVYVADTGNFRVQKFTGAGAYVTKWGSYGFGDGQFTDPYRVAPDSSGNVYVSDFTNNRIQKFDSGGGFVTRWSGFGIYSGPNGVATDTSGNVYAAHTFNQRVYRFTPTGTLLTSWGGAGSGDGQFQTPMGVAASTSGFVYVADFQNHRIQKFTYAGAFVAKWGSYGTGDGQFTGPYGVAVDSAGNVYVADSGNHRIQKFDSAGAFLTKWGSYGTGDGQFNGPYGVAVDSAGNVYVADYQNHRIQKFADCGSCTPPATTYPPSPGPSDPSTPGAGKDTVAPTLGDVTAARARLPAPAVRSGKRRVEFRYTLSEDAEVVFVIRRKEEGRRVGRRCVRPGRKARGKKTCSRYATVGRLTDDGSSGENTAKLPASIARKLRPGGYRAEVTATDAAGNESATERTTFEVVRR